MIEIRNKSKFKTAIEPIVHVLVWFYGLFIVMNGNLSLSYLEAWRIPVSLSVVFGMFCNIVLFYFTSLFLMTKYLSYGKVKIFLVKLAIVLFLVSFLETIFDYSISETKHNSEVQEGIFLSISIPVFIVNTLFVFLAFIYRSGKDWVKNEKVKNELVKDKLTTELSFLKAQINPHFLFNTLNTLYAMALVKKEETAEAIAKLSHLMRFVIYESAAERISLNKEIKYLNDYISLQRLRSVTEEKDAKITITFDCEVDDSEIEIAPMLLISIVENTFKHGISTIQKSEIEITLQLSDNTLILSTRNSIFARQQSEKKGVGLINLKRRLELVYSEKYEINHLEEENYHLTTLKLDLSDEN